MEENVLDRTMAKALGLLASFPPGCDFDDPVSMLQRNLRLGYARALTLAEMLEKKGVWSPLIEGRRFLARDLWLHLPDTTGCDNVRQRIEFIDAISRKKQRDVVGLIFDDCNPRAELPMNYLILPIRQQITTWLQNIAIEWAPCGGFADPCHPAVYTGSIYIDVTPDEANLQYQALRQYLDDELGQCRFPGVQFCSLALSDAKKNALYDEPGYFDSCVAHLFRRS